MGVIQNQPLDIWFISLIYDLTSMILYTMSPVCALNSFHCQSFCKHYLGYS